MEPRPQDHHLPIAVLTARCEAELQKFQKGEPYDDSFAQEILSRAVRYGDSDAWQVFTDMFGKRVLARIRRHPAAASICEDDAYWINRTIQRFMGAVGPDRLDQFPNMATVLGYLNMCGISVLLDESRRQARARCVSLNSLPEDVESAADVEGAALDVVQTQLLWKAVRHTLVDEQERLVIKLSCKYGYKPGQIYQKYADRFESIQDVYRVKRTALERLRRSPEIVQLLESATGQ